MRSGEWRLCASAAGWEWRWRSRMSCDPRGLKPRSILAFSAALNCRSFTIKVHGRLPHMNNDPQFRVAVESDADVLLDFMHSYYEYDGHRFDREKARVALVG